MSGTRAAAFPFRLRVLRGRTRAVLGIELDLNYGQTGSNDGGFPGNNAGTAYGFMGGCVTLVTVALLAAIFVAEVHTGALTSRESIIAMGALARARVVAGEYWRLLTAPWLHGGTEHLIGNAIALYILGMVCEAAFGRAQFVVLYVLSGLAGSIVSLLVTAGPSIGASGAIFGLQGAAIVLLRRERDRLLVRDRRVGFVLLIWAIYSIAGGLTDRLIDNGAHIGGALGGALIATRLHPVVLSPMPPGRANTVSRVLLITLVMLAYAIVGWIYR